MTCKLKLTSYPDEGPVRGYTDGNYIAVHQYVPCERSNGKLKLTAKKYVVARIDIDREVVAELDVGARVRAIINTKQRCAFGLAETKSWFEGKVTGRPDDVCELAIASGPMATGIAGTITGIVRETPGTREMTEWRK